MNCPECRSPDIITTDSRKYSETVTRRRKCKSCGATWQTIETATAVDRTNRRRLADRLDEISKELRK